MSQKCYSLCKKLLPLLLLCPFRNKVTVHRLGNSTSLRIHRWRLAHFLWSARFAERVQENPDRLRSTRCFWPLPFSLSKRWESNNFSASCVWQGNKISKNTGSWVFGENWTFFCNDSFHLLNEALRVRCFAKLLCQLTCLEEMLLKGCGLQVPEDWWNVLHRYQVSGTCRPFTYNLLRKRLGCVKRDAWTGYMGMVIFWRQCRKKKTCEHLSAHTFCGFLAQCAFGMHGHSPFLLPSIPTWNVALSTK